MAGDTLLFSEILSALSLNKVGGIFILKLFDIYTIITVKLLYLLNTILLSLSYALKEFMCKIY